jgi:hypothetical protein
VYISHAIDDCLISSASPIRMYHNPSSSVSLVSLTRFITQTINSEVVFQFSCNANLPLIFLEESSHENADIKYNMACVAITAAKTGSDLLDLSASLFRDVPFVRYLRLVAFNRETDRWDFSVKDLASAILSVDFVALDDGDSLLSCRACRGESISVGRTFCRVGVNGPFDDAFLRFLYSFKETDFLAELGVVD